MSSNKNISHNEIQALLAKELAKGNIHEEDGYVSIILDRSISQGLKNEISDYMPAGIKTHFAVKLEGKASAPRVLAKWLIDTIKANK